MAESMNKLNSRFLVAFLIFFGLDFASNRIFGNDIHTMEILKKSGQLEKMGKFEDAYELLDHYEQKTLSQADRYDILFLMARLNWIIGNPNKSRQYFLESLEIARILNDSRKAQESDSCVQIIDFYSNGKKLRLNNDIKGSLAIFNKALDICRHDGRIEFEMKCLRQMSLSYLDRGNLKEFLDCNEKALSIARKIFHKRDEGFCLNNIGLFYQKNDQFQEALAHFESSMAIAIENNNYDAESECLTNIGAIYVTLGNYDIALRKFTNALEIDKKRNNLEYVGIDLSNIAIIFRKKWLESNSKSDLLQSFTYLNECYKIFELQKNKLITIRILNNLGNISNDLDNENDALRYFSTGMAEADNINDKDAKCYLINNIGTTLLKKQKEDEALACFQKAIALAAEVNAGQVLWDAFYETAGIQKRRKDYRNAFKSYQYAMDVIEKSRSSIADEDLKSTFLGSDRRLEVFHGTIDLLYQMRKDDGDLKCARLAFQIMEKAKARGFLDSLEVSRVSAGRSADPEIENRLNDLRIRMSRMSRRLTESAASPIERKQWDAEASRLEEDYALLRREIRARDPRFADLRFPDLISLENAQKELLDSDTAIFAYAVGRETAYGLAIEKNQVRFFPLVAPSVLRDLVQRHLKSVSDREQAVLDSGADEALFQALIAPGFSRPFRHLIIIPDDILHYLPFETLRPRDGAPWLGTNLDISYAPSVSSLSEIRKRAKRRNIPPRDLLAVAAADREEAAGGTTAIFREKEVNGIAGLFDPLKCVILKGHTADETTLKTHRFGDFRLIHFAAHGRIDEQMPGRSAIILKNNPASDEDGFFQAGEVIDVRLNAELVALSSCRSASGRMVRGEGIVGLNRSFLFAGASAVLMSLWPVDDEATGYLMNRFYRHLRDGQTISESLRRAKTEMSASMSFSHPYFWAGFVINGAGERRLSLAVPVWVPVLIGSIIIFTLCGLLFSRRF